MTIVIEQAEWDEKKPYVDSSVFENLPEASEQLAHAECDLHKECKRLNKAVKRWAGSGLAPEMDLHLRRLLRGVAEHWSRLEGIYELVESMLCEEDCLVAEVRKARKLLHEQVGIEEE
jgi:hypothetical protein